MNVIDNDIVKTTTLDKNILNENLLDHERFRNASVSDDGRIYLTQRILNKNDTGDYKKVKSSRGNESVEYDTPQLNSEKIGGGKGAAIAFNAANLKGSALAFDEDELDRVLKSAKKGEKLGGGPLTTAFITSLISAAPEIIKGINAGLQQRKTGGGSSDNVYTPNGVSDDDLQGVVRLMKSVENQKKNLTQKGGELYVGSGRFGDILKKGWEGLKKVYNSEQFKPIRDALISAARNTANNYIDKAANKLSEKTSNEDLKNIIETTRDTAKDTVGDVASAAYGSGIDNAEYTDPLVGRVEDNGSVFKKKERIHRIGKIPGVVNSVTYVNKRLPQLKRTEVFLG